MILQRRLTRFYRISWKHQGQIGIWNRKISDGDRAYWQDAAVSVSLSSRTSHQGSVIRVQGSGLMQSICPDACFPIADAWYGLVAQLVRARA